MADAIGLLDRGEARLAEHGPDGWTVNGWLQQAILLHFRLQQMEVIEHGPFTYHDKIPLKGIESLQGVRVVPPATVRQGAFVEAGAVLMPSYVNIGSYVGSGTMIDTWATVGSGAQVGRDVHVAGGVGIGGVLEPPGARPVIIEDGAFLGSRCIITEGVLVEREAVIGADVVAVRVGAGDRRDGRRAGRVPRPRAGARDRRARHAPEDVPGRHLPAVVRARDRLPHRVDRPQDVAERGAPRPWHRRLAGRSPPSARRSSRRPRSTATRS